MVKSFQNFSSTPEIWIGLLIPGKNTEWSFDNCCIQDKVNPKIKEFALEMSLPNNIHPSIEAFINIAKKVNEKLVMPKTVIPFLNES